MVIDQKIMKQSLVVAIALIASVSCGSPAAPSATAPTKTTRKADSSKNVGVDVTTPQWVKDSTVNAMGDKNLFYTLEAEEKVFLDFPYEGGSTAHLIVRKKNGLLGAMFTIDKGQIDLDYNGTYTRVRFDDERPVKWSMGEAADGSSDILFFNDESKFVKKLKGSSKVVVEVPFFRNGTRLFVFNSVGLGI